MTCIGCAAFIAALTILTAYGLLIAAAQQGGQYATH